MSNPFYYLFGLLLASAYPTGSEPLAFARHIVAPWAALGALAVYGAVCWTVLSREPRRPQLARFGLRLLGLAMYGVLLFIFHFPLWVWGLGVEDDPLASSLLTLMPLFGLYGLLGIIARRFDPHGGTLGFAFRGFLALSFLPILTMLLLQELLERVEAARRVAFVYPAIQWLVPLVGLASLMLVLPPMLRALLGADPLPPGPLRDRLTNRCGAMGFDGAQLLLVSTGSLANAFVVGFSSRWRYVFFTRSIVEGMIPEHLECVLAHEVTHAQKRHILYYLFAAVAFSMVSMLAEEKLEAAGVPGAGLMALVLGWAVLFWGVAFGYVSRRFETEADLVAARVAPPAEGAPPPYVAARTMAAALDRVADLNGVPVDAPSWRHFNIARRMAILFATETDPSVGRRFETVCGRIRKAALVLFGVGMACGVALGVMQWKKSDHSLELYRAYEALERGHDAMAAKQYDRALEEFRKGIDAGADSSVAWVWRAECERALGREADARASEDVARKKGVADPRLRLRLE